MYEYELWYSLVKLPNRIKLGLFQQFHSIEGVWNEACRGNRIDKKTQDILLKDWNKNHLLNLSEIMIKNNIKVTTLAEESYPLKLKHLEDAPTVLFYKGDISKLNARYNVAIVGSRKCTPYGLNATKLISSELSKKNINIISGLARGIDSIAHSNSIDNENFTCAVLGCGLDIIYPRENKKLYDKIAFSGCIISEFAPCTAPLAMNFPIRNRIISGLSDLIIVVEAGLKSGSLITATLALEQGKDVMAVPGSIFSEQSKGTNKLIKDGAYPLTNLEDISELAGIDFKQCDTINDRKFTKQEKEIFNALSDTPIHIDDIIKITNIDIKQLYEVLFELQLKDEILCLAGNYYVKLNKCI